MKLIRTGIAIDLSIQILGEKTAKMLFYNHFKGYFFLFMAGRYHSHPDDAVTFVISRHHVLAFVAGTLMELVEQHLQSRTILSRGLNSP